jgi:hypothetical protein
MPFIIIKCPTAAAAAAAKVEAEAGMLWGVSLGATTTTQTKESTIGIAATQTRCRKIGESAPGGWWASAVYADSLWDGLPPEMQATYFLGKMDS